jgi:hypothetical protein
MARREKGAFYLKMSVEHARRASWLLEEIYDGGRLSSLVENRPDVLRTKPGKPMATHVPGKVEREFAEWIATLAIQELSKALDDIEYQISDTPAKTSAVA